LKKLLLIRHAKSSWNDDSINDKERPLNARGKKAAPFMAEMLKKKNLDIQLFICSPADVLYATEKVCRCFRLPPSNKNY